MLPYPKSQNNTKPNRKMNANLIKLDTEYRSLMKGLKEIETDFAEIFQEEMDAKTRAQNEYAYNDLTTDYTNAIKRVLAEMAKDPEYVAWVMEGLKAHQAPMPEAVPVAEATLIADPATDEEDEDDDTPIAVRIQENKTIATLIKEAKEKKAKEIKEAKEAIGKILEAGKLGGVGDTTIYYLKGKYYLWGDRHRAEGLIKKNKIEGLFKAGNITYTNASYGSKHTEFIPLY